MKIEPPLGCASAKDGQLPDFSGSQVTLRFARPLKSLSVKDVISFDQSTGSERLAEKPAEAG